MRANPWLMNVNPGHVNIELRRADLGVQLRLSRLKLNIQRGHTLLKLVFDLLPLCVEKFRFVIPAYSLQLAGLTVAFVDQILNSLRKVNHVISLFLTSTRHSRKENESFSFR